MHIRNTLTGLGLVASLAWSPEVSRRNPQGISAHPRPATLRLHYNHSFD